MGNQTPQIQEVAKETEIPVSPPENKPKSNIFKSKFFLGFIILSALIAFLAGGFYLGKNQNNKQVSSTPTPIATPTPTPQFTSCGPPDLKCSKGFTCDYCTGAIVKGQPTPKPNTGCSCIPNSKLTPTQSSTADWKTYSNTKRGYSFKYPADYRLRTSEKTLTEFEGVYLEKDLKSIDSGTGGKTAQTGNVISFTLFPAKDLTDSGLRNAYGRDIEISEEILDDMKVIKVSQLKMYDSPKYFYKYDPDVLEIDLEIGFDETEEKATEYLNIFNQILSTFTFSTSKFTN